MTSKEPQYLTLAPEFVGVYPNGDKYATLDIQVPVVTVLPHISNTPTKQLEGKELWCPLYRDSKPESLEAMKEACNPEETVFVLQTQDKEWTGIVGCTEQPTPKVIAKLFREL